MKAVGLRTRCPDCEYELRLDALGRSRTVNGTTLAWGCHTCNGRGYVYATAKSFVAPRKREKR